MSAAQNRQLQVFVWGQFVGQPTAGFTIVARNTAVQAHDAEEMRHHIMALLKVPRSSLAGVAYRYDHSRGVVFLMRFEQSSESQIGRQVFRQEYYVVWGRESYARSGHRFWGVDLPMGQVYHAPAELAHKLSDASEQDDCRLLEFMLSGASRNHLFRVLELLFSQEMPLRLAQSDAFEHDIALMHAVHLLLPPALRIRVGFGIGLSSAMGETFRVEFSKETSDGKPTHSASQATIRFDAPSYATQLQLYCDSCEPDSGMIRLLSAVSSLRVEFHDSWIQLGRDLATALWVKIGIGTLNRLQAKPSPITLESALTALKSSEGDRAQRSGLVNWVLSQLEPPTRDGVFLPKETAGLAEAIRQSDSTRSVCRDVIAQHWKRSPTLFIKFLDALATQNGSALQERWDDFVVPVLKEFLFEQGEDIVAAGRWLTSGHLRAEQYLQLCDVRLPLDLYQVVGEFWFTGYLGNPDSLVTYASHHTCLRQLNSSLVGLCEKDASRVAETLADIAKVSMAECERLIALLVTTVADLPSSSPCASDLIDTLATAIGRSELTFSAEHKRLLLERLRVISTRCTEPRFGQALVHLGRQLGVDPGETLCALSRTAQLRYYVHAFVYAQPDDLLVRTKHLRTVGELITDPRTSLGSISQQDLGILISLYQNYKLWPVVQRLLSQYLANEAVQAGHSSSAKFGLP